MRAFSVPVHTSFHSLTLSILATPRKFKSFWKFFAGFVGNSVDRFMVGLSSGMNVDTFLDNKLAGKDIPHRKIRVGPLHRCE